MKKYSNLPMGLIIGLISLIALIAEYLLNGESTIFWFFFIISFLTIPTWIINKILKKRTNSFGIGNIIKSKAGIKTFEKLQKYGKFIDLFSSFGIMMGFGAIGVDYLVREKIQKKWKRIIIFIISTIILSGINYLIFPTWEIAIIGGAFGLAGAVVSALIGYSWTIIDSLFISKQAVCAGVAPIIPGVSIPGVPITAPLHAWISFVIILVLHEGMHGLTAMRQKIKVDSTGIVLAGILPIGAFVEPNQEQFVKAKDKEKLKILSAGPMANIATYFVIIFMLLVWNQAIYTPFIKTNQENQVLEALEGIYVIQIDESINECGEIVKGPGFGKLEKGMQVIEINGTQATPFNGVPAGNQEFSLKVKNVMGEIEDINITPTNFGNVGFQLKAELKEGNDILRTQLITQQTISNFIYWLMLLSILVGIVNFLPFTIFDGGQAAKIIYLPYFGILGLSEAQTQKLIGRIFDIGILLLLIINALPLFISPF